MDPHLLYNIINCENIEDDILISCCGSIECIRNIFIRATRFAGGDNSKITIEDIKNIKKSGLTMELINKYNDGNLNFNVFHKFKNFSIDWLFKYPDKKWNAEEIEKKEWFFYDLIEIFDNFKWSSNTLKEYIKILRHKEKHKRKYKNVLDELITVVYHPDNAERLGLFETVSKDDFL